MQIRIKDFKHIIISILLSFSITSVVGQDSTAQQNNKLFKNHWKQMKWNRYFYDYYPFKANNFSKNNWFHLYYRESGYAYDNSQFLINENLMKHHMTGDILRTPIEDFLYNGNEDSLAYSPEEVFFLTKSLITEYQDSYVMSYSDFIRDFDSIPKYIKALVIDPGIFIGKYDKSKVSQILEKFVNVEYIEVLFNGYLGGIPYNDDVLLRAINFVLEMPTLKNLKYLYIPTADTNQLSIINDKCTSLKALWVNNTRTTIEPLPNPFMANADIHFLILRYRGFLKGNELRDIKRLETLGLIYRYFFDEDVEEGGIDAETLKNMTNLKNLFLVGYSLPQTLNFTKTKLEYVVLGTNSTLINIKKGKYLKTLRVNDGKQKELHVNLNGTKSIESIELDNKYGGRIQLRINSKVKNLKTLYMYAPSVEIISKYKLPKETKITINYIQDYILPLSRNKGSKNTEIIQNNEDWYIINNN